MMLLLLLQLQLSANAGRVRTRQRADNKRAKIAVVNQSDDALECVVPDRGRHDAMLRNRLERGHYVRARVHDHRLLRLDQIRYQAALPD